MTKFKKFLPNLILIFYLFCLYKAACLFIYNRNSPEIMLYTGLLICLFPFLPSGNIFGSNLSVFIYLFIGLIMNDKNKTYE